MKSIIGVFLLFSIVFSAVSGNNYCSLCQDHTMCLYQGLGPACKEAGNGGVTEQEKKEIVDLHNWYRSLVAKGSEKRGAGGAQPKGANIMKMFWDDELASIAQRWADQCRVEHDKCRNVARWRVGQNLYWSWSKPASPVANWTAAIQSWYEEVTQHNPQTVTKYKFNSATGHYTQLVWHNSARIGCGRRDYGGNKLYACNYGPSGNVIGTPMYEIGEPCSKCPAGSSCSNGLCVNSGSGSGQGSQRQAQKPRPRPNQSKYTYDTSGSRFNRIGNETSPEEIPATELPIALNIIDDLELINNDEEIRREVDDLRRRILELTQKILEKRIANN